MEFTPHNHVRSTHVYTRVVSALVVVTLMAGCSSAARDASTPPDPSKINPVAPATTPGATLFSVGGSVSGLFGGGLVLQNNAGDNLGVGKDGDFQFATSLAKESAYKVNVLTQPSAPSQTCAVTPQGSGTIVAANITDVAVTCSTNTYTVTASAGANGTISLANTTVAHGGTTTITVTPNTGYTASISGCFGTPMANVAGPTITYVTGPVTAACTVTASFTIIAYAVSGAANPALGGTVATTTPAVNYNTTANFTVTAATGYKIVSVSGCGGAPLANVASPITYATGPVTAACAVTANFTIIVYAVSGAANPVLGGTVTTTTPAVNYNTTANFTVTAATGYKIVSVSGCGGAPLTNVASPITYATGPVTAACAVTASFSLNSYTVTATASANGAINPGSATVNHGLTTNFTVTPSAGYTVSVTGCGGKLANGVYTTAPITSSCSVTARFVIVEAATSITAGYRHTCALTSTGAVRCWGRNLYGELGNGSNTDSAMPVAVIGLGNTITALAAGDTHTCALTSAGAVQCWGRNNYGQLGSGGTADSNTATTVSGLSGPVTALAAGYGHTCALTSVGDVQCWGWNVTGQLGNNSTMDSTTPVTVVGLSGLATAVVLGTTHTCAAISSGAVQCWGSNSNGELGNGSTTPNGSIAPVTVTGVKGLAMALEAGYLHTCALSSTGAVECWGYNYYGQLGSGSASYISAPVTVINLNGPATALGAGGQHSCALSVAGTVQCWGINVNSELGNGSTTNSATPVNVIGLSGLATALTAGFDHTCVVTTGGTVQCWGLNDLGQLGNGSLTSSQSPIYVFGFGG